MSRLEPLTEAGWKEVEREFDDLMSRVAKLGNVIGPSCGAAFCDMALRIEQRLLTLKVQVEDRTFANRARRSS